MQAGIFYFFPKKEMKINGIFCLFISDDGRQMVAADSSKALFPDINVPKGFIFNQNACPQL